MRSLPRAHPGDLTLMISPEPGETYKWSPLMIARASREGTFELLSAVWERTLGFGPQELTRMSLRQLMRASASITEGTVAAILDEDDADPVDLVLFTGRDEAVRLLLHRRYDPYIGTVFIVAEVSSAPARGWIGATNGPPRSRY